MKPEKSFSPASRLKSFNYALQGLSYLIHKEPNMLIHFAMATVVIASGFIKQLSGLQWVAIIFAIALVIVAEIFNTCIEKLCDVYCGNKYESTVKIIKDISAAAVLIAALASILTGIIVFTS